MNFVGLNRITSMQLHIRSILRGLEPNTVVIEFKTIGQLSTRKMSFLSGARDAELEAKAPGTDEEAPVDKGLKSENEWLRSQISMLRHNVATMARTPGVYHALRPYNVVCRMRLYSSD